MLIPELLRADPPQFSTAVGCKTLARKILEHLATRQSKIWHSTFSSYSNLNALHGCLSAITELG